MVNGSDGGETFVPERGDDSNGEFPGDVLPGVYLVASRQAALELTEQAASAGMDVAWIDGTTIDSKASFLAACARELRFPDYFGHNWDAFNDSLRDLGYGENTGVVIVFDQFDRFATHDPREWGVARDVLRRATTDSRHEGNPMYVVLRGTRAAAPDIPDLSPPKR